MSLERFVQAQEASFEGALAELKAGRKTGHWIWWIFPQLKGLGTTHNSTYYGLADEVEAAAYLAHPVLGSRYRECLAVVYLHICQSKVEPRTLMGSHIDVLKLRSSLELFRELSDDSEVVLRSQALEVLKVVGLGDQKPTFRDDGSF